jgi:hypothetical protein
MRWRPGPLLPTTLALAALLPACSKSATDPFATITRTVALPADADVAFTANNWSTDSTAGREVFAARLDGSGVTQITFCNDVQACDMIEAAFSPDGGRVAARRRLAGDEAASLQYFDLARSASAELVPPSGALSGIDWAPINNILVYSGTGTVARSQDLYRTDAVRPTADNQQQTANLTCVNLLNAPPCDPAIVDRRPRVDPGGQTILYERIAPGGKGEVYILRTAIEQSLVVPGGSGTGTLPGSGYVVGGNADPGYSPDGTSVVFRRLTAVGSDGLGTWDLLTAKINGTGIQTVVTGNAYRGAPDWGGQGILFPELDPATHQYSLVVVQPDGSGRHVVLTLPPGFILSYPRWLK